LKIGSLIVKDKRLSDLKYNGDNISVTDYNPWKYDVKNIACIRRENYTVLEDIIKKEDNVEYFTPLKKNIMKDTIPQSFPICIIKGDRDRIYELINESGYGVVSLYHTLIKSLQYPEYQASLDVSKCIMNLPVHQDVNNNKYRDMVKLLVKYCKITSK